MIANTVIPIKAINVQINDPKDTSLVVNLTIKKTNNRRRNKKGAYPKINPHPVATAFPPLKFRNIENECPKQAKNPYRSGDRTINLKSRILNLNKNTSVALFKTSKAKTIIAYFFPSTRPQFVAPTLPLPSLVKSTPLSLPIIYPNGILPIK